MTLKDILAKRKRDKTNKVSADTSAIPADDYTPQVIFRDPDNPFQSCFEGCTEF